MGKLKLFDLEKNLGFHKAYHGNPVNVWIHLLFVWPLFFTTLVLFYFTPPLFECPFKCRLGLVPNFGLIFTLVYVVYYVCLDRKAGTLAAFLCLACWVSASLLAKNLGFSLSWKIVLATQLFCWSTQIIGHAIFESRSPSVRDNLAQALLMVPFLVLLDALQIFFGYEPYPGFNASVKANIDAETRKWQDNKEKKIS
ncbi:2-hydroxy-palmitic acid dioxygenase mpo1-like [Diospyros lotus]|uniref:2-hydroxy-palmitic acid dioxygenase mpo1-like n=1 Tax=Diospyros lotus TaxID=55363 RepID=UPI00225BDFE7|nr:2-hydroxy-palmitic acid dioxygenase mpo1-like [Diospyros lotus]